MCTLFLEGNLTTGARKVVHQSHDAYIQCIRFGHAGRPVYCQSQSSRERTNEMSMPISNSMFLPTSLGKKPNKPILMSSRSGGAEVHAAGMGNIASGLSGRLIHHEL